MCTQQQDPLTAAPRKGHTWATMPKVSDSCRQHPCMLFTWLLNQRLQQPRGHYKTARWWKVALGCRHCIGSNAPPPSVSIYSLPSLRLPAHGTAETEVPRVAGWGNRAWSSTCYSDSIFAAVARSLSITSQSSHWKYVPHHVLRQKKEKERVRPLLSAPCTTLTTGNTEARLKSWRSSGLLVYNPSAREPKAGRFVVRSSICNIARPGTKQKWFRGSIHLDFHLNSKP